jgi:hypothetical protein
MTSTKGNPDRLGVCDVILPLRGDVLLIPFTLSFLLLRISYSINETTFLSLGVLGDLPEELLGLIPRLSWMTRVQTILPIHDDVVADVIDIGSISSIRLDIDILEDPVEARVGLAAIDLDNSLAIGITGKILEGNVGPFECTGVWVQSSLGSGIGKTGISRVTRETYSVSTLMGWLI